MMKRLAVLAVIAVLHVQPLHPQAPAQPGNHATNAEAQQKPESKTPTIVKADECVCGNGRDKKDPVSTSDPDKWVRRGFWLDTGLTAITLIIAIATLLQANAAKMQARTEMDADRAWVLIEGIRNPQSQLFALGYAPGIVYHIKVYGNTPAKIRRERYRCRIVPAIPGTNPAQPQLEAIPVYPAELNRFSGSVSPPGYSYFQSVALESGPLTEKEYRELHNGTSLLCSYCCIEYTDIFGRDAITRQCLVYDFAFGAVFQSPDGTILNPPGFRPALGAPSEYNNSA